MRIAIIGIIKIIYELYDPYFGLIQTASKWI